MRYQINRLIPFRSSAALIAVGVAIASAASPCRAEEGFRSPVYRVANTPEAPGAGQAAARTLPPGQVFDLDQRPGEHPLMPVLRVAKQGLAEIDERIQDYSCTVTKRERIDGELGEHQHMFVRVRHEPYSVYMYFLKPYKGREVLYVPSKYDGNLCALSEGIKRRLGILHLPPDGRIAMMGQKYPITKFGIRNLAAELIQVAEQDINYGECEVKVNHDVKINKRPVTKIEVIHPKPRKNFRYHVAKIYIDNELRVPIRYASWMWPAAPGGELPLEEEYTYTNIKLNNGYDDATFDENNPEIFKR